MPLPSARGLLAALESDSGQLRQVTDGSGAVTTLGDPVEYWGPLAQGSSLGNFTGFHGFYHPADFGAGLPGVRGDGSSTFLGSDLAMPVLTSFELLLVFRAFGAPANNEALVYQDFTTGFEVFRQGTTADSWGCGIKQTVAPYGDFLTAVDGPPHILSVSWRGDSGDKTIGFDGHTNETTFAATATGTLAANVLSFLGHATGSNTMSSMAAGYLAGNVIWTALERNRNLNYLGRKYGIALGGVPATGSTRVNFNGGFPDLTGGF